MGDGGHHAAGGVHGLPPGDRERERCSTSQGHPDSSVLGASFPTAGIEKQEAALKPQFAIGQKRDAHRRKFRRGIFPHPERGIHGDDRGHGGAQQLRRAGRQGHRQNDKGPVNAPPASPATPKRRRPDREKGSHKTDPGGKSERQGHLVHHVASMTSCCSWVSVFMAFFQLGNDGRRSGCRFRQVPGPQLDPGHRMHVRSMMG